MNNTKELYEFLLKETPDEGGCMLCLVTYKINDYDLKEYFLIERHNISNGVMFTINGRFFFDYEFVWTYENHWNILYKNYGKE